MELILTSDEALRSIISDAIAKAIGNNSISMNSNDTPDYLTEKQACEFMAGMSKQTFYKLVKQGKIQKIQLGERRTAYCRTQIAEYLKSVTKK